MKSQLHPVAQVQILNSLTAQFIGVMAYTCCYQASQIWNHRIFQATKALAIF